MSRKDRKVIILQGISGSGKTIYAKTYYPEANIVSMDKFRIKNGVYKYDSKNNKKVRQKCRAEFLHLLDTSKKDIIVDNTNLFEEAIMWYVTIALSYKLPIHVITLLVNPKIAAKRVKTGTPLEIVKDSHKLLKKLLHTLSYPEGVKHTVIRENLQV